MEIDGQGHGFDGVFQVGLTDCTVVQIDGTTRTVLLGQWPVLVMLSGRMERQIHKATDWLHEGTFI